jgi:hypothetical protein
VTLTSLLVHRGVHTPAGPTGCQGEDVRVYLSIEVLATVWTNRLHKLFNDRPRPVTSPRIWPDFALAPRLLKGIPKGDAIMKTISKGLILAVSFLGGCASTGGFSERGVIEMQGQAVRAFAVGPAVVHASGSGSGGRLFTTESTIGTDADCAAALAHGRTATPLPGDHVDEVTVERGSVACIASSAPGPYELSWHARTPEPATAQQLAMARRR